MMKLLTFSLLFLCCAFSNQSSLPESWEQSTFPEGWMELKKGKKGYVLYQPCEGSMQGIVVKNDTLHMNCQLQSYAYLVREFEKIDKDHYVIHCSGLKHRTLETDFEITVLDRERKLVRWDAWLYEGMDTISWVMTAREYAKEFRTVKQVCKAKKGDVTIGF